MIAGRIYACIYAVNERVCVMSFKANEIVVGFADRLRQERERLGLTQDKFGHAVDVSRVTQSNYEQGVREPGITYLSALGRAGCDLRFLLFGEKVDAQYLDLMDWELHDQVWDWVDRVAVDAKGRPYPSNIRKKFFRLAYRACRAGRYNDISEIDLTMLLAEAA